MARRGDAAPRAESPALGRPGGGAATTVLLVLALTTGASAESEKGSRTDYPIRPVPFTAVTVEDGFWSPRLETNRTVTVRYDFQKCERTGRVANFARAGGLQEGDFEGLYGFNDSDVFKVIEGASYALSLHPDAGLERYLEDLASKIAAAQEDDGYLYTVGTIGALAEEPNCAESQPSLAAILDRELRENLREAIGILGAEQRLVVEMRLRGLTTFEIGNILGLKPATVRKRESRAVENLKVNLVG